MTRWRIATVTVLAAIGMMTVAFVWPPPGPRSLRVFDADRIADLEVDMWQAYYRKEKLRLFSTLVVTLREQYHYPWSRAVRAGFHFARAAAVFGDATGDYERVLPDLEVAFSIARDWTQAHFDPARVARAELAWWVARRVPSERNPENVGRLIGDLYSIMYEVPADRVRDAGVLRARAGDLRDKGESHADWDAVSALLHQSYRSLHDSFD